MFRCQACKEISKPKEKMFKLVTEKREVTYHNFSREGGLKETSGVETVKEISLCGPCFEVNHG